MKRLNLIIKLFIISLFLISCNDTINHNDIGDILKNCKGHAVVIAKGYNSGNFKSYRYYLIIKDDSSNCFEYVGAEYYVNIGDTLK